MKLRTTLAVVLVVITLVVGGVVYGSFEFTKQNTIERGQQNVDETAATVAEQIAADLDERRDRVGFVASQPTASEFGETARTIDPFLENSRFYAAQVLSANGTVIDFRGDVADAVRESTIGTNIADEPYIQRAIDGETTISDPIPIDGSDGYILVVSAPIFEEETVVGVFSAAIRLDRFTVFRATEPLETSVQTVSVAAGDELLRPATADFDAASALTATAGVESTDWTVTVRRDRASLQSELEFMAIVQVASLWVVLMSIVGLGMWEYRVNLSQTNRLLSGFQAVREGLYDHRLALAATDEWERISAGFNDLTAGISRRETAIKEREQRLEVLNRVLRHNLRNDMAVIINYADMLPQLADDPQVELAADKITTMGRGLTKLGTKAGKIEQAFQSAEDGLTTVDLSRIVTTAVTEIKDDYPEVEFEVSMPDTVEVLALSTVAMAVENLCENAAEHNTNTEPVVEVTVEELAGDDTDPTADTATSEPTADTATSEPTADTATSEPTADTATPEPTADTNTPEATDGTESVEADSADAEPETGDTDGGPRETRTVTTGSNGRDTSANRVRLTVADNGPTIVDQEINVLTEGRETAMQHGSGLGLWLVYWLAEKSEADLLFEDSHLGGNAVSLVFRTPSADDPSL